jgi:hypothetical protein
MSSLPSPTAGVDSTADDLLIENAVVRIVSAAAMAAYLSASNGRSADGLNNLSAKSIRHTLETEFQCNLLPKKPLILKVIYATLLGFDSMKITRMHDDDDQSEFVSAWGTMVSSATASGTGHSKDNHVDESISGLLPLASDKRTFACDICEYRCTSSPILSRHKRLHSIDRNFGCDKCKFRFSRRDTLKAHMRIHSEISKKVFKSAVVRLVEAAVKERKTLSARKLRKTLEEDFARDFSSLNDMILLTIKTTLDNIHKLD